MHESKPSHFRRTMPLLALCQAMVVVDVSVVNVALPAIQQTFGFTSATLQWVITAYIIMFGGFLMLSSRIADIFGRRKMRQSAFPDSWPHRYCLD